MRYFRAVGRFGSSRRAAAEPHVSASAIDRQILPTLLLVEANLFRPHLLKRRGEHLSSAKKQCGFRSLDAATCPLIFVRGRFSAAHDAAGRPTASTYATKITWSYPDDIPPPVEPKAIEIGARAMEEGMGMSVLHVAPTGIISACDPAEAAYANVLRPPDLCHLFPVGSRFSPPAVRKGKPVRRIVTVKIDMGSVVAR